MDFSWDEVQDAIAQSCRDALDHAGEGSAADQWKALGEAGLLTLGVPARLGGEGLGLLETAIVLTEVGQRALHLPALATLALGVLPVARFADQAWQDSLLGEGRLLTAAVAGLTVASTVDGVAYGVPYGLEAHRILVQGDGVIAVVDPGAPGVGLCAMPTSSGAPEAVLRCEGVAAEAVFEGDLRYFAVAAAAAVADGLLRGALDLTAEHVATRHQFGRPLATFQAVAQQIADVYIAWRTTHLTALAACVNPADAALAAYWLRYEAQAAMRTCHHLHGGIGLDITYRLHRYTSMLKDLLRLVGVADASRA